AAAAGAARLAMGDGLAVSRAAGVILLFWSGVAQAQDISLGEAVGAALKGAPEAADAKLAVVESGADVKDADGAFDLRVAANWTYSERFAPVVISSVANAQILRLRDFILDQQVSRRFSTGTEVALEYLSLTESVLGETDFSLTRESVQLRLTQPLLRG